jgi:inorganic phosphate transporter, PiT family
MIVSTMFILGFSIAIGFIMACAVGANDVANAMGTSVGAKVLTLKQAIWLAAIFEAMGAFFASGQVTQTIQQDLLDQHWAGLHPHLLMLGMLAALCASAVWLIIATVYSLPVSTTHTIIGAVVGFALLNIGADIVQWSIIFRIILSWFITPIIAGLLAFCLFRSVQRLILQAKDPIFAAYRYIPYYMILVIFTVLQVALYEIVSLGWLHLQMAVIFMLALSLSVAVGMISTFFIRHPLLIGNKQNAKSEQLFGLLVILTACTMAFAHGSNDVANAIGPLASIVQLATNPGSVGQSSVPFWILALGAFGVLLGLASYGYRVINTVGMRITPLTPSRGFAAQLATAMTVLICSGLGLPVSSTQILVGAVLGVGMAGGVGAIDLKVVQQIFMSWFITVPIGAILAMAFFTIFQWLQWV